MTRHIDIAMLESNSIHIPMSRIKVQTNRTAQYQLQKRHMIDPLQTDQWVDRQNHPKASKEMFSKTFMVKIRAIQIKKKQMISRWRKIAYRM